MIRGLGIDLVETARFGRALERHGRRLERRIFTADELETCRRRRDRILALAARFAAKEACLKAFGTGWSAGLAFRQVEVVSVPGGRPELRFHGAASAWVRREGIRRAHVSLSHQPGTVGAVVVLEA